MKKPHIIAIKSFLVLILVIMTLNSLNGMEGPNYLEICDMKEQGRIAEILSGFIPPDMPKIQNTPEFNDKQILNHEYWEEFKQLSDCRKNNYLNDVVNAYISGSEKLYFYDEFRSYCIGCLMMGAKLNEHNKSILMEIGGKQVDNKLFTWIKVSDICSRLEGLKT